MLLGGNFILIGENNLDDLTKELLENKRLCFVGELPKNIVAIMGFKAYTVGLRTIMSGENKSEAKKVYQQIVEVLGSLAPKKPKERPTATFSGLVWIEQVYKTTFTCGLIFGKDQDFTIFHTDVMDDVDDAIGTLKELVLDEVKEGKNPIIEIVTDEDLDKLDHIKVEQS